MDGGRGSNAGGVGGMGAGSGWLSVGERERAIEPNQTYVTSIRFPFNTAGFPRLSFYVLCTAGAAGVSAVLEEFAFENRGNGVTDWLPLQAAYAAPLNVPRFNGTATGHAPPATLAVPLVRMSITAGNDPIVVTWYISASL